MSLNWNALNKENDNIESSNETKKNTSKLDWSKITAKTENTADNLVKDKIKSVNNEKPTVSNNILPQAKLNTSSNVLPQATQNINNSAFNSIISKANSNVNITQGNIQRKLTSGNSVAKDIQNKVNQDIMERSINGETPIQTLMREQAEREELARIEDAKYPHKKIQNAISLENSLNRKVNSVQEENTKTKYIPVISEIANLNAATLPSLEEEIKYIEEKTKNMTSEELDAEFKRLKNNDLLSKKVAGTVTLGLTDVYEEQKKRNMQGTQVYDDFLKELQNKKDEYIQKLGRTNYAKLYEKIYNNSSQQPTDYDFFKQLRLNIGSGITSGVTNIATAGSMMINNELGEKVNDATEWSRNLNESILRGNENHGEIGKNVLNASNVVGNMVPTMGATAVNPALGNVALFANSAGGAYSDAIDNGATLEQAKWNGILSGATELAIEKISGGVSNNLLGTQAAINPSKFTSKINNKVVRGVVDVIADVTGEGLEEVASTAIQPIIDRITYNPYAAYATPEEMWNSFTGSILPTLMLGGIGSVTTGIDNYSDNVIKEIENSNLSQTQKESLIENVIEGEENLTRVVQENANTISKISEMSNTQKNSQQGTPITQNQVQGNEVIPQNTQNQNTEQYSLNNATPLRQSINQLKNKGISIQNTTIDALESVQNNRPGLTITFDESVQGNGVYTVDENGTRSIKLNPNSSRAIEFTLVHELSHDLKAGDIDSYNDLQKYVLDFAKTKEGYEIAKVALGETYAKQLGDGNFNLNDEATNDILGEAIGNQEFLNSLAQKKPNVFQRMYNWFKNVLFDGNNTGKTFEERRFLNSIQSKFKTAYDMAFNNSNIDTTPKYHISSNLSNDIDNVLSNINERNPVKVRDYTPSILVQNGIKDLPMYENPSHIRKNILTAAEAQNLGIAVGAKDHYHGLGKDIYIKAIDSLDDPRVVLKYKNMPNQYIILTVVKDNQNNNIIVPIEVNTNTYANNIKIDVNRIKSVYGYDRINPDLNKYIKDSIKNNNLEKIYEKKKPSTGKTLQSASINSIPSENNVVNDYYMQNSENNAQNSNKSSFSLSEDNDLMKKYKNINLNENISDMNGVPAIELNDGSIIPIKSGVPHVEFIISNNIDVNDIRSGGWITDGLYEPTEQSDTLRYVEREQAKQRYENKKKIKDIRYSQNNDTWQKFLDDNFNLMPNATRTMGERMQQQIADDVDTLNMQSKNNTQKNVEKNQDSVYSNIKVGEVKAEKGGNGNNDGIEIRTNMENGESRSREGLLYSSNELFENRGRADEDVRLFAEESNSNKLTSSNENEGNSRNLENSEKGSFLNNPLVKTALQNITKNQNANKVSYTNDFYRNMRNAFGEATANVITGDFDKSKLNYINYINKESDNCYETVVKKLGIKIGSKEARAIMDYGEGKNNGQYTLEDLKKNFPNKWQQIVEADNWFRDYYNRAIDEINTTRKQIYPYVEETIEETKSALIKTNELIRKAKQTGIAPYKVDIEIQDSIKRLEEQITSRTEKLSEVKKGSQKYEEHLAAIERYTSRKVELENLIGQRYEDKVEMLEKRAQELSDLLNSNQLWTGKRIMKRSDYYHHFTEMAKGFKALKNIFEMPSEISTNLVGVSETTKPKSKFLNFAQQRWTDITEHDAIKGFLDYLPGAAFAINIDPEIDKIRDFTTEIRNNTEITKNANHLVEYLDDFANSIAGKTNPFDRPFQKLTNRKVMKGIEWVSSRIKANAVLGNINSAISQALNLPQILGKVKNPKYILQGLEDFTRDVFTHNDRYTESQFMKERYNGDLIDKFDNRLIKVPAKAAKFTLGALDEAVGRIGWNALYRKGLELGVEDPIQYADNTLRDCVAGRGIGERTIAQESKIVNLLMPFTVEVGNYNRVLKDFVKKKDFGGLIITLISAYLCNKLIELIGGSGRTTDYGDAIVDAVTEEDLSPIERVGRVAGEFISSLPAGQQLATLYPENGAEWGDVKLPTREKVFGEHDPTRFGTGNILSEAIKHPITSVVLPWGGTQVRRTIGAIQAIKDGGVYGERQGEKYLKYPVNSDVGTIIKSTILGTNSLKEASDYFENGGLSVRRTQGYEGAKELDIPAKVYLDINKEVNEIQPENGEKYGKGEKANKIIAIIEKYDLNKKQRAYLYQVFAKNTEIDKINVDSMEEAG